MSDEEINLRHTISVLGTSDYKFAHSV